MIALYILAGILCVLGLILLLPVSVNLKYNGELSFKVKFAGIKVFEPSKNPKKAEENIQPAQKTKSKDSQLKSSFKILKEKHGFIGAVKEIVSFIKDCLNHLGLLLKTMKFKKICLDLSVAGSDAAQTAIQYGEVCSAVYPVLSFFQSKANVKYKQINIKGEFEKPKGNFSFNMVVNLQIVFLLIAGFRIYKEYKKFVTRNGLDERKQN